MSHEVSIPDEQGGLAYGPGNTSGRMVGEPIPGTKGADPTLRSLREGGIVTDQLAPERIPFNPELNYGAVRVPGPRSSIQEVPPSRPPREEPRAPSALASYAPAVGSPEASRLNRNLGLPEFSLSSTVDQSPMGQKLAQERETPSQGAVRLTQEDYLRMYPDLLSAREARDRDPGNVELMKAENQRAAEYISSIVGPVPAATATGIYSALKMLSGGLPETGKALLRSLGVPSGALTPSSDPMGQLKAGLRGSISSQGAVRRK